MRYDVPLPTLLMVMVPVPPPMLPLRVRLPPLSLEPPRVSVCVPAAPLAMLPVSSPPSVPMMVSPSSATLPPRVPWARMAPRFSLLPVPETLMPPLKLVVPGLRKSWLPLSMIRAAGMVPRFVAFHLSPLVPALESWIVPMKPVTLGMYVLRAVVPAAKFKFSSPVPVKALLMFVLPEVEVSSIRSVEPAPMSTPPVPRAFWAVLTVAISVPAPAWMIVPPV
ncbi:MAG: hypothetical protein BWX88_05203 [Planctomycetes bacterium ADurb.Bin126]|nr:MAG: hypothetical protein BWX88_05203 [Planctomycetes bacterium ADurb.Bin126]